MPGFLGVCGKNPLPEQPFSPNERKELHQARLVIPHFYAERRSVPKFPEDKILSETDRLVVLLEGVILNSRTLCQAARTSSFRETVIRMAGSDPLFFRKLEGSFSGLLYDKITRELLLFTDQTASKQVFYAPVPGGLVFGSEVNYLLDYYKRQGLSYHLDITASYLLLTFGFMAEDYTLFREIRKLEPGTYLRYQEGQVECVPWFRLSNKPDTSLTPADAIEQVDTLFRQAVQLSFEKDREYGYRHLVALSAGLDARMVNWVAHELGYSEDITDYTFAQSGSWDDLTSRAMAAHLKHEWLFKNLDSGNCLKHIEEVVKITSGGALYAAQAHAKSCLDLIDPAPFGLYHSGQLGDVILGTYYSGKRTDTPFSLKTGAYSQFLSDRLRPDILKKEYENEEIFKFYTRGFIGMSQGLLILQEHSETYSPFYHTEFMQFCLSIPLKYRFGHSLYDRWIRSKYPDAARFPHNAGRKIGGPSVNIGNARVNLLNIPTRGMKFLRTKFGNPLAHPRSMNPFDYWYHTHPDLRDYLDGYYQQHLDLLRPYPELCEDCQRLYQQGRVTEKTQVLTLLAALNLYFS